MSWPHDICNLQDTRGTHINESTNNQHRAIRREFEPVGLNPAQEFCLWHVEAHKCVGKSCTALMTDNQSKC